LKLETYFGSFYKKRINHKDFQLSTALNLKKKWFSCAIKLGASCDVNENYSCATGKKIIWFNLRIVWLQIMIMFDGKIAIYHFTDKCILSIHKKKYKLE
jgi:hypothetical protein